MRNNGTVGGNVNIPYKESASYRGLETDTAKVTVDNTEKTIAVDVTDGVTEEQLSEIVATLANKTDLQNAINNLSDEVNAKLDNKQAILIPGDNITISDDNVISAKTKSLPNLEIQFANSYEESPKYSPVSIDTNDFGTLIPGTDSWFDFIDEILETCDGMYTTTCYIYMDGFPSVGTLCSVEVSNIKGQSFIRVTSVDPMGSSFIIRYDEKNGKSYDFSNWIGASANTRLIIFNEDTNEITLDTVLVPPYVSTADRDIEYRLNNLLTYFGDMIYDKVYPEITFKVVSDNWDSYVSPGEKVYKAQLGLEYNDNNNTYIVRISTSDGVYELTFGQELLEL